MLAILRFNFASPGGDPGVQGELVSAALELAQFGDRHRIAALSVDEQHATGYGWICNPVMIAAMFLARTANIFASIDCALGPGSGVRSPRGGTKPHPPLYVGGGVRATVRRAVVLMPPAVNRGMICLHDDPERAWPALGEHMLWEAVIYGRWSDDPSQSVMHLARGADSGRSTGLWQVPVFDS
ncbi:hypothetical protein MSAR_40210 [Mycolicibacterium sarraceniae]|uniref:Uncharacterized protein n=1 Tax=Mycolicibacterium sarraceniae TaxID=1534348 RepID=A0A7I7SY00_9MYCO|nr:hypothetical protein MSAR_40210 [Mycolicibacterium sarraceniae]